ncbi:MAG: tetratricopeptide repeat protein [Bryobacterales bacterium]
MTNTLRTILVGIALALAPLPAAEVNPQSNARFDEGKKAYAKEDYNAASEAFEQAVELASTVPTYHVWLGRAYGRRAENTSKWKFLSALSLARKTLEHFERAAELDPNDREALQSLLDFYREAPGTVGGGMEKAEAIARKIEKLYPADGARAWASIYEKRDELGPAEAKLREAVKLEPGEVSHLLGLASFLSRRERYEESDKLYQQALRMAPDLPDVWFSRGKSLVRAGRGSAEARDLLSRYSTADLPPDAAPRSEAKELLKQL